MSKTHQALSLVVDGISAVVIAIAIFIALANIGLISRPASEDFTFGS
jgi:Co/Zn/Cd efflux system component